MHFIKFFNPLGMVAPGFGYGVPRSLSTKYLSLIHFSRLLNWIDKCVVFDSCINVFSCPNVSSPFPSFFNSSRIQVRVPVFFFLPCHPMAIRLFRVLKERHRKRSEHCDSSIWINAEYASYHSHHSILGFSITYLYRGIVAFSSVTSSEIAERNFFWNPKLVPSQITVLGLVPHVPHFIPSSQSISSKLKNEYHDWMKFP